MTTAIAKMWAMIGVWILILMATYAAAQTLTTDAPTEQKVWEVALKLIFPAIWTAVSPFVTKGVTWGMLKIMSAVPASVQVAISSVVGAVFAGLAGAIPDFPLGIESAATMGFAGGATGQLLAMSNPAAVQPKVRGHA